MNASFLTLPPELQRAANNFFIDNTPFVPNTTLPTHQKTPVTPPRRAAVSLSTIQARLNELRAQQSGAHLWHELAEGSPVQKEFQARAAALDELVELWQRKLQFASPE